MIVLTAPTGTIGRQLLARLLTSSSEPLRIVARDPGKLPAGLGGRAEVIAGSHGDPAVIERALAGADALFWLTPPPWTAARLEDGMERFARPAADAVRRHGVRHVVGISNLGRGVPGYAGVVTHAHAVEDLFTAAGAAYRALALPGFMDNLTRDAYSMHSAGRLAGVLDPGLKVPMAATRDIADVAAGLLLDRAWDGQETRPVLGPEDLSMDEVSTVMSDILGRPVAYTQVTMDDFRGGLRAAGASPAMADGMAAMMTAKNAGLDNAGIRTPATSSPTTLRAWASEIRWTELARQIADRATRGSTSV